MRMSINVGDGDTDTQQVIENLRAYVNAGRSLYWGDGVESNVGTIQHINIGPAEGQDDAAPYRRSQ